MWNHQNLLLTICIALRCVGSAGGVVHVAGYLGGQVDVSCSYDQGYESYEKYLCKNDCAVSDILITTLNPVKNKYSIHDDKRARIFTTTISDLRSTDPRKYWCGVSRFGIDIYTEVKLKLVEDSCCNSATKIKSYEGYSESIICPYESQYQNNLKFVCRGNRPSTCLRKALITSDTKQNGRFRLHDEKESRKFTVTINSLRQSDSGSYLCGVRRTSDLDDFSAVKLDVQEWCCVKSHKTRGVAGSPLTLQCPYPPQHRNYRKFLCKGDHRNNCRDMVTSQSRFALQDDVSSSSFTVKITELEAADAGTYWCVSDPQWTVGNYIKIELSVDSCCDTVTKIKSYEGYSESIICPYESQYQNNLKFVCRGNQSSTCLQQALITSDTKQNGRFTLDDKKESRKFTVTISSLRQSDSGSYLCGVQRTSGLGDFSAVDLDVQEWCCVKSHKTRGVAGSPLTLQCPYPPQHRNYRKFLCKGDHRNNCRDMVTSQSRFALQDDVSSSSFTVKITELEAADPGTYWCVSDPQWTVGNYTKIELSVDSCCDTVTKIQSYEGYSESIICPYESQYQNNLKFVCRGNQSSTCLQQALITSDTKQNGRFTLDDKKELRKFTVTISSLRQSDSGSYLCGVRRTSGLGDFSAVDLEVQEWCCVKSHKTRGVAGGPLTLQCPYPPQHRNNRKFLCKGDHRNNCRDMVTSQSRFALQDVASSSSFTVKITALEAADAGTYWCVSDPQWTVGNYTKIELSVDFLQHTSTVPSTTTVETLGETPTQVPDAALYAVYTVPPVLLLLICVLVVVVYKYKHYKVKGHEPVMHKNTQKAEGFEEVMDTAGSGNYGNQEFVMYAKKQTAQQRSASNHYDNDADEDEPEYGNIVTTEEIYCNENFYRANRR